MVVPVLAVGGDRAADQGRGGWPAQGRWRRRRGPAVACPPGLLAPDLGIWFAGAMGSWLQSGLPIEQWVDIVVVLDKGVLLYSDPRDGSSAGSVRPWPGSELRVVSSASPLLVATLAAQTAFRSKFMREATLGPYLGPEPWGTVEPVKRRP